MPQKKRFEVLENETIADCLDRMKQEGYRPVRRMEKPVFQAKHKKAEPEYLRQQIIFEGVKE